MAGTLAAVLVAATVTGYLLTRRLAGNVARVHAFAGLDNRTRPAKPANTSLNFVLMGSDSRSDQSTGQAAGGQTWVPGDGRSDTLMLVHLAADRRSAAVISIPRDSWVPIPDHGTAKINAAYSWGGPPLAIRTVEQLTGDHIDHFAAIDFAGLKAVVDAVGGVDIQLPADAIGIGGVPLHAGVNHMDGTTALAYVRERHSLPRGDFDRVQRQQNLIRAIMTKVAASDPATNPVLAYQLIDAATKATTVDDHLTNTGLQTLAASLYGLRPSQIAFVTAPVKGTGWEGDQSVVYLDPTADDGLWAAVRTDTVTDYLATHQLDHLPDNPN